MSVGAGGRVERTQSVWSGRVHEGSLGVIVEVYTRRCGSLQSDPKGRWCRQGLDPPPSHPPGRFEGVEGDRERVGVGEGWGQKES